MGPHTKLTFQLKYTTISGLQSWPLEEKQLKGERASALDGDGRSYEVQFLPLGYPFHSCSSVCASGNAALERRRLCPLFG